ncbi:MAG: hypothetical protein ACP5J5_08325 [Dissulfurimicrobium sp.]
MKQRPGTLGMASRIPGMTPAAITALRVYLRKCGADPLQQQYAVGRTASASI